MSRSLLKSLVAPACLVLGWWWELFAATPDGVVQAPRLRPELTRRAIVRPEPASRQSAKAPKNAPVVEHAPAVVAPVAVPLPTPLAVPAPEPLVQQSSSAVQSMSVSASSPTVPNPSTMLRAPFIQKRGPLAKGATPNTSNIYVGTPPPIRVPLPESIPVPIQSIPVATHSAHRSTPSRIEQAVELKPIDSVPMPLAAPPQVLSDSALTNVRPAMTVVPEAETTVVESVSTAATRTVVRNSIATVQTMVSIEPPRLVPETAVSDVMFVDPGLQTNQTPNVVSQVRSLSPVGSIAELSNLAFQESEKPTAASGPQVLVPAPAAEPEEPAILQMPAPQQRVQLPEPAKLQLPLSSASAAPAAVVEEFENQLFQLQTERSKLQQTVSQAESFSSQASSTTTVRQTAEVPQLVTQVVATMGDRRANQTQPAAVSASQQFEVGEICQAAPLPNNYLASGQKLYCKGLIPDAELAFRTAMQQAETPYQRLLATYLVATCLRRQDKQNEATELYEYVADQKTEPTLASLARWQLNHSDMRRPNPLPMR